MIGKYIVYKPAVKGNAGEEWRQCLKQIIYNREDVFSLIKLNIFIDVPDFESVIRINKEVSETLRDAFGDKCPSFSVIPQPPEKTYKVNVEAAYVESIGCEVSFRMYNSIPYVLLDSPSGKQLWAGGIGTGNNKSDTRKAAEASFMLMKEILDNEGFVFDNIVRQWNYIGNILEIKNELQNYQVFNEVRNEFYNDYRHVHCFPAATGIGMKHGGVILDFCAVADNNLVPKPVDNPNQVNAYEYGQQVLKGKTDRGKDIKHPPQFERALLMAGKNSSTLFVSGTASIIGQETIGINDIEKQTEITIDNINKLTDRNRMALMTGGDSDEEERVILIRVYIRNQNDFGVVKSICEKSFPEVPAVFVEADVCRDNLLVEIEAEVLIDN